MIATTTKPHRQLVITRHLARLVSSASEWNEALHESAQGNLLQSYEWGEFKAGFGWRPRRLLVTYRGRLVGGAQALVRQSPLGAMVYVPRGPFMRAETIDEAEIVLESLHALAREVGAIALKIEPETPNHPEVRRFYISRGFHPAHALQPRSTAIVDLRGSLDEVRSRFHLRTRHNLAKAIQKGVRVVEGDESDLPSFHQLLEVTSRHRQVPSLPLDYFRQLWRHLHVTGLARLFLATYRDELIAGALILVFGRRASYMYGASNGRYRDFGANDLLQWTAMQWAQGHGCVAYDLCGVPDEVGKQVEAGGNCDQIDPAVWGDALFKRGFGGAVVRYAGAFDHVYSPRRYWVISELLPVVRPAFRWLHHQIGTRRG